MSAPPYNFDANDADVILRTPLRPGSDEFKDFRIHKPILSIASTLFRDMFSLPQPATGDDTLPVIPVTESAEVFEIFLRLIYPLEPPAITSLQLVDDLFQLAEKYMANSVHAKLKHILVSPSFLRDDPIWVYTLACRAGLNAETELAIPLTFNINLVRDIPLTHLRMMTGETHNRLLTSHADRRAELTSIIRRAKFQTQDFSGCACGHWFYTRLRDSINLAMVEKPFLDKQKLESCLPTTTSEESKCGLGSGCRLSERVISEYFTRILDKAGKVG